ncbi:MAG: AraC family transcriptional regulator [Hominilimicola sp.]
MEGVSFRCENYMYSYAASSSQGLAVHSHKYYEFLLFLKGDATYLVENSSYKAQNGDIFLTSPGELHTISFNSACDYERHFIQISREWLTSLPYELLRRIDRRKPGENNRIPAALTEKYKLSEFFENIHYYITHKCPESDIMVQTYIIQFMAKINTIFKTELSLLDEAEENKTVSEIKEYINRHFTEGITLDELAGKFYMNKYYLCHIFKKETGLTIKEFINTRRIARAKQLLPEYGSVRELYLECGFNDYSTFYKTFKRFTGTSPTEFLN